VLEPKIKYPPLIEFVDIRNDALQVDAALNSHASATSCATVAVPEEHRRLAHTSSHAESASADQVQDRSTASSMKATFHEEHRMVLDNCVAHYGAALLQSYRSKSKQNSKVMKINGLTQECWQHGWKYE
jgi:hypothetical protein